MGMTRTTIATVRRGDDNCAMLADGFLVETNLAEDLEEHCDTLGRQRMGMTRTTIATSNQDFKLWKNLPENQQIKCHWHSRGHECLPGGCGTNGRTAIRCTIIFRHEPKTNNFHIRTTMFQFRSSIPIVALLTITTVLWNRDNAAFRRDMDAVALTTNVTDALRLVESVSADIP